MTSDGTYNYTYDSEGNRTRKTTISGGAYVDYTWDYHNRLTDVTFKTSGGTTTKKVHYTYDVADRLIGRQIDTNGDGTYDAAARYVNDWSAAPQTNGAPNGLGIGTGLDDTLFAFDGSGSLTNRYLSGPAVDQVFADERASGALYWSLADNLGTVRDVAQYNSGTNTTTVVDHLKYDSFGNITAQSDSTKQPLFAYTGRQWDSDAGLQYTRARWFDPRIGRFISEDPSGFDGGDININRYVLNGPVNTTDPSGLEPRGKPPIFKPGFPGNPIGPANGEPPLELKPDLPIKIVDMPGGGQVYVIGNTVIKWTRPPVLSFSDMTFKQFQRQMELAEQTAQMVAQLEKLRRRMSLHYHLQANYAGPEEAEYNWAIYVSSGKQGPPPLIWGEPPRLVEEDDN